MLFRSYENEMPFKIIENFIIEQTEIILANPFIVEFEIVLRGGQNNGIL